MDINPFGLCVERKGMISIKGLARICDLDVNIKLCFDVCRPTYFIKLSISYVQFCMCAITPFFKAMSNPGLILISLYLKWHINRK